jgi:SAM-dependent methyltransferase
MASSEILAYPCDPIHYTETFGVTVLEACACGTVPVLCTADAFGELWGSVGLNVPPPYHEHKDLFVDYVTKVMNDAALREKLSRESVDHAQTFSWPTLHKRLEECLLSRGEKGLPDVKWGSPTVKLNIGCGPNVFPFSGWINYDREDISEFLNRTRDFPVCDEIPAHQRALIPFLNKETVDFRIHDLRNGFSQHPDGSVDAIYLGQIIEHLNPLHEAPKLIKECHRMLKPGGVLRITTPDLDLLIQAYLDKEMDRFSDEFPEFYEGALPNDQLAYVLYGSAGPKSSWDHYEGHMHLYARDTMSRLFQGAGFKPRFFFYDSVGESQCPIMAKEAVDLGMGHSFISEAVR